MGRDRRMQEERDEMKGGRQRRNEIDGRKRMGERKKIFKR